MLSNQVLQKIIVDIKRILDKDCSVWSDKGKCLAATGAHCEAVQKDVENFLTETYLAEMKLTDFGAYFAVYYEKELRYVLAIHGAKEGMEVSGKLCVSQFENLMQAYKKRVDKNQFFRELLLGHVPSMELFSQAKKLSIPVDAKRVVLVIEPRQEGENLVLETLKGLYATGTKDFIATVEEGKIILVKTVEEGDDYPEVNEVSKTIVDTLSAEAMVDICVAYGTIVDGLQDVNRSYKEACMALEAGRVFYAERTILAYNELGIGRLIYQLPLSLCDLFLKEVCRGNAMEQFDKETLTTVNAFFKNNLNISETARQMYLHRNTLGYRLDKITKTTGLDVRKFDDALTFKIALMVSEYMKFAQSKEEEQK